MDPLTHRQPIPGRRFTWGRIPDETVCTWRLFRMGEDRRRFMEARTFHVKADRGDIARELWRMRRRLFEAVEAYDFAALGMVA